MGGGSGGGSALPTSLQSNLDRLASRFGVTSGGNFGTPGTGNVRIIQSNNPHKDAKEFFDIASRGGVMKPIFGSSTGDNAQIKGWKASLGQGVHVVYRPVSLSDGSPAVQITFRYKQRSNMKIHFVKKGD